MARDFSTSDIELARRTEAAEAANGFGLARGAEPGLVEVEQIAGGCAMFAGAGSPLTHALGIGMNGKLPAGEFDRMEEFFRSRGSASLIDLCPLADMSVVEEVMKRGYRIIEFNNLLLRRASVEDAGCQAPPDVAISAAGEAAREEWCRLLVRGFSSTVEIDEAALRLVRGLTGAGTNYLARLDSAAVATAGMSMHGGVAMLYGDTTIAAARGRGVQQALIRHRLAQAARAGCEWAMACVIPGSGSHRNYERSGFELFYMRVNVQRDFA
ncbi:MAG: GNAT family N-acetyltransferase [Candidatus Solibacter usitatus]|nr:GNAT family N-acetyltransferase [Candidatus Solibacter usitatus]